MFQKTTPRLVKSLWVLALLCLSGCATSMSQTAYLSGSLEKNGLQTRIQNPERAAERFAESGKQVIKANRLIGGRKGNTKSFAPPYRSRYGFDEEKSSLKQRALIDVAVHFDVLNQMPAYRFVLTPQDNISAEQIAAWKPVARVAMSVGARDRVNLLAPLPTGNRLVQGQVVTPWVFCASCIAYKTSQRRLSNDLYLRQFGTHARALAGGAGSRQVLQLSFIDAGEMATGLADAQAARKTFGAKLQTHFTRQAEAKDANMAYYLFLRDEYLPLTMKAKLRASKCSDFRTGPNTNQNAEYHREEIQKNERAIRCTQLVADKFDFKTYVAAYPKLLAREQALWDKTYGRERTEIIDPQGQLEFARKEIELAYNGIEQMQQYAEAKEAQYARKRRAREAQMAAFQTASQNIQTMMQQTRENQVVVTSDGMVSTVGEERRRAVERAKYESQRRESDRRKHRHRTGAPANHSDERVATKTESPAKPPGDVAAKSVKAPAQPLPSESKEKPESNLKAASAVQQEAPPSPAAPPPEKPQPLAGGMQGCVTLVETKRYPGKSPHSSCSYNEPDREALTLKFRNNCGVPVNVTMDLLNDTGETETSGEYNIKPGRERTSVGFCGAIKYSYRYEETRESVARRSQ